MSSRAVPPRAAAAFKRVKVAIDHLEKALKEISAAQADLSTVVGAPMVTLSRLQESASREVSKIRLYAADPGARCTLDHDPDQWEMRCGHGPRHGCGKGRRS